ncbi:hypothetical protein [Streptomyces sp. NPDC086519]|uniref:hypothetical protein n=1 Tax=Streptomyces sp. NPDC086519 TaxID=3154863 RepID=UPI00344666D3
MAGGDDAMWLSLSSAEQLARCRRSTGAAVRLRILGDDVDITYYWDAGHGADDDPGDLIPWSAEVTGPPGPRRR